VLVLELPKGLLSSMMKAEGEGETDMLHRESHICSRCSLPALQEAVYDYAPARVIVPRACFDSLRLRLSGLNFVLAYNEEDGWHLLLTVADGVPPVKLVPRPAWKRAPIDVIDFTKEKSLGGGIGDYL